MIDDIRHASWVNPLFIDSVIRNHSSFSTYTYSNLVQFIYDPKTLPARNSIAQSYN